MDFVTTLSLIARSLAVGAALFFAPRAAAHDPQDSYLYDRYACASFSLLVEDPKVQAFPEQEVTRWAMYALTAEGLYEPSSKCRLYIQVTSAEEARVTAYRWSLERPVLVGATIVFLRSGGFAGGSSAYRRDSVRSELETFIAGPVAEFARNLRTYRARAKPTDSR